MRAVSASTKGVPADEAKRSVLLLPAVVMLAIFFILPILLTVYYSFTNLALTGENARILNFIGFENYRRMLEDPSVEVSIINTLIFLIGSLIGQQVLGFTWRLILYPGMNYGTVKCSSIPYCL